jgi:hypothetical protein
MGPRKDLPKPNLRPHIIKEFQETSGGLEKLGGEDHETAVKKSTTCAPSLEKY